MDSSSLSDTTDVFKNIRLVFTCLSVAANTITAGGVFIFPILAPFLAARLKLSQPQLTTVALAGMAGQYPFAVFAGKVIDNYGPWLCSLAASILFSLGFGLFSLEVANAQDASESSLGTFIRLSLYFFLCSLGTMTSYFSALFAANKNFPEYLGMATGTSMALFGLSPLFLTTIASSFFEDDQGYLDVIRFVAFLAIICGLVNFIGTFTLQVPSTPVFTEDDDTSPVYDDAYANGNTADERTPLISGNDYSQTEAPPTDNSNQTLIQLLTDKYFLLLLFVTLIVLGSSEMVISNIGSIVLSLPPSRISQDIPSPTSVTSTQVRILSFANTISRLVVGPLADFVSPVASYVVDGVSQYPRKHMISRVVFLSGSCVLLIITFGWMELGVRTQGALWALSLGTGIAYGTAFTVLPSILSSVWGMQNVARNFGVITYAPFIGTPLFSYLYAFVSDAHVIKPNPDMPSSGICVGVQCWQLTFAVALVAAKIGLAVSIALWRHWKGRV